MVNRANRGFANPGLQLREGQSGDVVAGALPAGDAFSQLANIAEHFGAQLNTMAAAAAKTEGQAQAALDIQSGLVKPRNDATARGEGYDGVAGDYLSAARRAALNEGMTKAYVDFGDQPDKLGPALDAVHKGLPPTGLPALDAALNGDYLVRRSDFMARSTEQAHKRLQETARANFISEVQTSQSLLDQVSASAGIDPQGAKRVAMAGQQFIATIAKYGPKTAFSIGEIQFPADDTRRDALSPEQLAAYSAKATVQSKETWLTAYADTLPDARSRKIFAAQVEERWKGGDPIFAGLDGADMDRITGRLDASARRAEADERSAQAQASDEARNAIEAFQYGQEPDWDMARQAAAASGDAGLMAQVDFYASASPEVKGVLKTVVARQLGLFGPTTPGETWVDATGQPVDHQALAAQIGATTQQASGFFSRVLGTQATVTSAKRSEQGNTSVGGSRTSAHLRGEGWDIKVPGQSSAQTFAALRASGMPFDQLLDEGDHVHVGLGPKMRGQALIKNGNAWTTPSDVKPGTPAYAAWASARDGFSSDPLNYVRGGANRAPIANVPVVVPEGAFARDPAQLQAWGAAMKQRQALGQTISRTYGVPPRLLTNGEREYYKAQVEANPTQAIALARAAYQSMGEGGALSLMRELGESAPEASASLHIADLYASGSSQFATAAAQGMALISEGKQQLPKDDDIAIAAKFDKLKGAVPPQVLIAARITARAAMLNDQMTGTKRSDDYYVNAALGTTSANGRLYGGVVKVNGRETAIPHWLDQDRADDALEALGHAWERQGNGPVWSNGEAVTGTQMAGMQMVLSPSGSYRFVNPRTGNPVMKRGGGVFELDMDRARPFLSRTLGAAALKATSSAGVQ